MSYEIPARVRIRYAKRGRIRYTSQRDMARIFERSLRRTRLPIEQSKGFSPHPLLAFSLALPTGCESMAEYVDFRFEGGGGPAFEATVSADIGIPGAQAVAERLQEVMPDGIEIEAAACLTGAEGSLQEQVTSCDWIMEVAGMGASQLSERVAHLLAADNAPIQRTRKGRLVNDDLRSSILALSHQGAGSSLETEAITATLATKPRGVRPAELLTVIDPALRLVRGTRTGQYETVNGERVEPLSITGRVQALANVAEVAGQ